MLCSTLVFNEDYYKNVKIRGQKQLNVAQNRQFDPQVDNGEFPLYFARFTEAMKVLWQIVNTYQ